MGILRAPPPPLPQRIAASATNPTTTSRRPHRRAFTIVELIVCFVVALLGIAIILPALGRPTGCGRPLKDSTQIRGVHQGFVLAASSNQDRYPLPSLLDAADTTIAAPAETKDTTANILSYLIFNSYFSPELCVSPAEQNANIRVHDKYAFSDPPTAADPKKALWDPAFSADFTNPLSPGNTSYAHNLPSGKRLATWSNTFSATEAILGNRGPQITGVAMKRGSAVPTLPKQSNTYAIHGGRDTWEGNIAYNDNSVRFETSLAPETALYTFNGKVQRPDIPFFDEPDDDADRNAYLSIWTQSGASPEAFKPIWD